MINVSDEQDGDIVEATGELVYELAQRLGVSAEAVEHVMHRELGGALLSRELRTPVAA
jgi:hypothetical protein